MASSLWFIVLLINVKFSVSFYVKDINSLLFNGGFDLVDLTHSVDDNSIYWSDMRPFRFVKKIFGLQTDGTWYAANDFCAGEHGGTHIDAPYHFNANGIKVGDIPIEKLIVPMYVVDISSQVNDDPNFVLRKHHLNHMLNVFDTTKPSLVVFKFGWSKFYPDPKKYLGLHDDLNGTLSFPGLSGEVAEFIVRSYPSVVGVGLDTASVDPGSSTDFLAHKTLMQAGLYVIENVKLDRNLPDIKCTALALPMKLRLGTGAPLRLAAICPKQTPISFSAKDLK